VFSGVISGAGNLAITGTGGKIILTGTNTYTGTTTITMAILKPGQFDGDRYGHRPIVDNGSCSSRTPPRSPMRV